MSEKRWQSKNTILAIIIAMFSVQLAKLGSWLLGVLWTYQEIVATVGIIIVVLALVFRYLLNKAVQQIEKIVERKHNKDDEPKSPPSNTTS